MTAVYTKLQGGLLPARGSSRSTLLARSAKFALCGILGALTLACSSTSSDDTKDLRPTPVAIETTELSDDSLLGEVVSSIVPGADQPLEVVYQWTEADPRYRLGPGIIVLRQRDGVRRWDAVHQGVDNPRGGWLVVEGEQEQRCDWGRVQPSSAAAWLDCKELDGLDTGPIPAITAALQSALTTVLPRRTINARQANCYEIDRGGSICLDAEARAIVYLRAANPQTSFDQVMTADEIKSDVLDKLVVEPLPAREDNDVPPEAFSLPALFQVGPFEDPRDHR